METKNNQFKEKLNNFITRFSNNLIIKTVANGMMLTLPVTLVGSLLLVAQMLTFLPEPIMKALSLGATVTTNFIALYILIGMTFSLARELKSDIAATILLSITSYFILTPITPFNIGGDRPTMAIDITYLGSKGIFVAMIVAIFTTWLFTKLVEKNVTLKMPSSVPPFVSKSFAAIIPIGIVIIIILIISSIFSFTSFGNIHDFIYTVLQTPLQTLGASIWSALLLMFKS